MDTLQALTRLVLPPQASDALRDPLKGLDALNTDYKTLVLAGNPNVGKSVVFNALTGRYAHVSNFPGTTVDVPKGTFNDMAVQDTPGVYGLSDINEEERVARSAIEQADVVINVINASTLGRDLFLTQQLIDTQRPLVALVNQLDEAQSRGIEVDLDALAEHLNVPVMGTIATDGFDIELFKQCLSNAAVGHNMPDCPDPEQLAALEANPLERTRVYGLRRQHVNTLVSRVVTTQDEASDTLEKSPSWRHTWSARLGQACLNPWIGIALLFSVLFALYQIVGVWVAGDVVNFLEGTLMLGYVVPAIQQGIASVVPQSSWVFTLLGGEFGLITMTLQYVVGVLFPLVLGFYLYLAILEDCGYLPRVAVLSDTLLSRMGLNGRAVIPIILGFGCVTMATVSTRMLNSTRERTIASTLLAVTIPCSAQLAVIMALMAAAGGLKAWGVYLGVLFVLLVGIGSALNMLLPGRSTPLLIDLPPMRWPRLNNIWTKAWLRTKAFLWEASPLFALGALLVSVAQLTGALDWMQAALIPVTVKLLHLPAESASAFVMGVVRRDFGAAGLLKLQDIMTPLQILTALITITLFVPCIASAAIFWKERGFKEAAVIIASSWVLAFGVGAIIARLFTWIPII